MTSEASVRPDYWRQLLDATTIARKAHYGQFDKCGAPYIDHPLAVSWRLKDPRAMTVAVLHDVLEDTSTAAEDLLAAGIDPELVEAVRTLSRRDGESYADFIERIAAAGPLVVSVKLADLAENLREDRPHPDAARLRPRYLAALERLRTVQRSGE